MGKSEKLEDKRRGKGFAHASSLLGERIREVSETRGFAVSRLLTRWSEVAGPDIAALCRPVEVSYGRSGLGATLTLLTTGAQAPMLEMQKETLRERVNACYGYSAISRIRFSQTAPTGFSEGRAQFAGAPVPEKRQPDPEIRARAEQTSAGVADAGLRAALEALGHNVLSKASGQSHQSD